MPARPAKRDGAFCQPVRADESRIMMNFKPSYNQVSTLAHELGHAYHNLLPDRSNRPFNVDTPMTLAETASTFCEVVRIKHAALDSVSRSRTNSTILEAGLQGATQIVNTTSRRAFAFERAVLRGPRRRIPN